MLLTGCGVQQKQQVEYRTISQPKVPLPADLTSPIEAPAPPEMMTFGDSVSLNAELYGIVAQCNIDRAAIMSLAQKND
ncbi:Rz1-like lysis system protein LysC [Pantoea ananatis]|uniref:Rz1-like lysis system protein LysC n=1 Tax=Pantoea ananas TaxID=553 RepID=UPI003FA48483